MRAVVCSALQSVGYEVLEASNGREGLGLFRQRPPDLVIADIHMPELNGLDVIMELTREFLNVKVIAISGGARVPTPLRSGQAVRRPSNRAQAIRHRRAAPCRPI